MGCFLTITSRDFAQLSTTMKAGVSVVGASGAGGVKVQVHPTALRSAREMAKQIRRQAKTAKVTTGNSADASKATPTKQRMEYQIATLYQASPVLANVLEPALGKALTAERIRFGKKEAEGVAAKILEQSEYILSAEDASIPGTKGVDIRAVTKTGTNVVVEVKSSYKDEDFGKIIHKNKKTYPDDTHPEGYRQMTDGWLKEVSKDIGGIDLEKTNILGVHINTIRETVTIYRRIDSEARHWKPLMTKPLSSFNL